MRRKTTAMRWTWLAIAALWGLICPVGAAASPSSQWEQATSALAGKIAEVLGPGEARVTIRNLSSIPTDEIPAIRRLLEADLKSHSISVSGAESANSVRVTLSESAHERLWVAEIAEGNETKVTMIDLGPVRTAPASNSSGMTLRKQAILSTREPLLAALEVPAGIIVLEPEQIAFYVRGLDGWRVGEQVRIQQRIPIARDPHGVLRMSADGQGFEAWLAGAECTGPLVTALSTGDWAVRCSASDDPWPITPSSATPGSKLPSSPGVTVADAGSLRAFYNTARNYFTGVVIPGSSIDLPPFYSAAEVARSSGGAGFLVAGIDGKVQLVEYGASHPVAGTRDWGSDFAVIRSGCGTSEQIIVSGSGEASHDSLRAYELPAFEAVPASAPLPTEGTVTALWTSPDLKSAFAVMRNSAEQYEVDRVTVLCN